MVQMTDTQSTPTRSRSAKPKIERAALELFVTSGVDAATTREIAERAGVSEGALYRHYKGKDELALSLFMSIHNRMSALLIEAASGEKLEDKVRGIVTAYARLADEDWLLVSYHLLHMHRFLQHDVRRDDDPVSLIEALIRDLIANGELEHGDPELLASMVLGIVLQPAENKVYNRLTGPFSNHIDAMVTAILAILTIR